MKNYQIIIRNAANETIEIVDGCSNSILEAIGNTYNEYVGFEIISIKLC